MWVHKAKSKEAKMLRPSGLPRGTLKMGRSRPRKHRDVSGAKAQILRLINQKNTPKAPRTYWDTTPWRKERQVQTVIECLILLSLPLGSQWGGRGRMNESRRLYFICHHGILFITSDGGVEGGPWECPSFQG